MQHARNVTGTIQPIADVGRTACERDVLLLVDAAQTIGHVPIDVQAMHIDLLAFPGHKGPLGRLGAAGLCLRPAIERRVRPQRQGGTGSVTETPTQPDSMPDRYESGSQNAIGLAGLCAVVEWILERGVESLRRHDQGLSGVFLEGLRFGADGEHRRPAGVYGEHLRPVLEGEHGRPARANGHTLYGPREPPRRVSVFSVRIDGLEPAELSARLESEFGDLARSGIHCAPLVHELLCPASDGGTTRLSFSALYTQQDVRSCTEAMTQQTAGSVEENRY